MRGDNGTGFNNRKALNLRLFLQCAFNPDSVQSERRIDRFLTRQRPGGSTRVNGQPASRIGVTAANFYPFHQNSIAGWLQIHIVSNVYHRRQEAHILGKFLTNTANSPQQLTILLKIHHWDQAVTNLHAQRIFQLHVVPCGFHHGVVFRHFHRLRFIWRFLLTTAHPPCQSQQCGSKHQKHQVRHARNQPQKSKYRRTKQHDAGVAEQLGHHLFAYVLVGTHAGHDNTRRGRDNQRRNLCHQPVTDGQQGITFRSAAHAHTMLQHPNRPPTTLITMIKIPAMASPRTNLLAPSIEP